MTKDEAKQGVRIIDLATQAGYKLNNHGNEVTLVCPNPDHNDKDPSCSINLEKNLYQCLGCDARGDVFNWVMMVEGCDFKSALVKLGVDEDDESYKKKNPKAKKPVKKKSPTTYKPPVAKDPVDAKPDWKCEPKYLTASYEYKDHSGNVVYWSKRFDNPELKDKKFQLIHKGANGEQVFGMKGVTRVPYNYPDFAQARHMYFVEGEKCADGLNNVMGMPATCICGGSKAWIPEYAEYFKHLESVTIIPDNDKTGRKFAKMVADAIIGVGVKVKIADMITKENGFGEKDDVYDFIADKEGSDECREWISEQATLSPYWAGGVQVDGKSPDQLNVLLKKRYESWQGGGLDIKRIFPEIPDEMKFRPLVGGDVLVINASTGAGKTALAQNIAVESPENPIPWFSLELSETRMHERNLILTNEISGEEVERRILNDEHLDTSAFDHIEIYDNALANLKYLDEQLTLFRLKTGKRPQIGVIDYIQLMDKPERGMSEVEGLKQNSYGIKRLAKKHNMVFIVLSQIGRKDEANLFASKGSGAIEESATVMMGLNYIEGCRDGRRIGIDKNSNGDKDYQFTIGWDGSKYKFTHLAPSTNPVITEGTGMHDPDGDTDNEDTPF